VQLAVLRAVTEVEIAAAFDVDAQLPRCSLA